MVNRLAQNIARYAPGAKSTRVFLHRLRGVHIGRGCFIGTDVLLETAWPKRVFIGDRVVIGIRAIVVGHFDPAEAARTGMTGGPRGVTIEDDAFIGPGVIILPNVRIGTGAVVTAGSVVTRSVPPHTVVRGNPAMPVARCRVPLRHDGSIWDFYAGARRVPDKTEG